MSELLLIHGACFGAWAWEAVVPELARRGHSPRAIDLPGRAAPARLADQAEAIAGALDRPTVLVGHSAGGYAITAAAGLSPLVAGLIYLCAYVPKAGMSLAQMRRAGPAQPMAGAFVVDRAAGLFGFDPARAQDLFFHDCNDETARLCRQAIAPMEEPLPPPLRPLPPRAAILCRQDRAIPPEYQAEMAEGIAERRWLDCGHAPFLAEPAKLAATISDLANAMQSQTAPDLRQNPSRM